MHPDMEAIVRSFLPRDRTVAERLCLACIMQCHTDGDPTTAGIRMSVSCAARIFRRLRKYGVDLSTASPTSLHHRREMNLETKRICVYRNARLWTFVNVNIPVFKSLVAYKVLTDEVSWYEVDSECESDLEYPESESSHASGLGTPDT